MQTKIQTIQTFFFKRSSGFSILCCLFISSLNLIWRAVLQCRTTSPKAWWEQLTFFEQIVQKNAWGSSLTGWMQGFFFGHSLSNLQRYVAEPSSFLVLWSFFLFFFSSVFPSPSFFTFLSFLILSGGGTCITSTFFSVLLLDGILSKRFVMSHFLRIGLVSFGFTRMSRSGIKRTKWFGCQSFSKSVSLVCHHNIDAVFSVFTRGEIVTFKSFRLTMGFFDSG